MPRCSFARLRRTGAYVLAGAVLLPAGASAQGIGFSVTPTVEEARWGEDLLIPSTVFPGALASAHFGRFVSLDAHYFQSTGQDVEGAPLALDARRWGGDIFVALAPTPLAPFLRFGAGVLEFQADGDGAEASRHLAASLGGGLRIQVRDRLSGEVSVRRLSFRAGPGSGVVEDDGSGDPVRDIGTYTIGAGLRVPLGGTWDNPATDEAVRNLRTLAVPTRLFAGSLSFAEQLALDDHPVMGALVGVDLGPFVGTSLYAFGSARDGLTSPEQLYGYGFESSFNLVRRGAGATPHVILGGGRVHFTEADRATAALDGRKKWTATVGAGVDFRVTDRFRGEIAARNLVLTQRASTNLSSPDQLRSNWMISAGVRFVLGGGSRESGATTPSSDRTGLPTERAGTGADPSGPRGGGRLASSATTSDDVERLELERDRLLRELEVERLRQALARLTEEGDPSAAERLLAEYRGDTPSPTEARTFELPVIEEGEYRIRFGPEGRADSAAAATDADVPVRAPAPDAGPREARDPRVDRLVESVARLEGRLEEIADRAAQPRLPAAPGNIQVDVAGAPGGADATGTTVRVPPRGVLRGAAPGFEGAALYTGARVEPRSQGVVGLEVDVGSAFGGSLRVRPGLALGLGSSFIWGVGTDVAWPLPFTLWGARPGLTAGISLLREDGITRVMIPDIGLELGRPLTDRLDGYLAYQTRDLLDDQRLVVGVRLRPAPEAARTNLRVTMTGGGPEGRAPAMATPPADLQTQDADTVREADGQDLRNAIEELRSEVGQLRDELAQAEELAREAERRTEEARQAREEAEARAQSQRERQERDAAQAGEPEPDEEESDASMSPEALLDDLRSLERLEAVPNVRRISRGVAIVLGGDRTFAVGQSTLSSLAHSEIELIAQKLLEHDRRISIEGHTDATGGEELNQRLSEDRAASVRAALIAHGLETSRLTATGFGLTRPVAGNDTPAGRAANRRVEIVILTGSGS